MEERQPDEKAPIEANVEMTAGPTYNHAEAFCLMPYLCEKCRVGEWLYNTRDGVTPFMIGCAQPDCDGNMQHASMRHDIRIRPGEILTQRRLLKLRQASRMWCDILIAQFIIGEVFEPSPSESLLKGAGFCVFQIPKNMRVFIDLSLEKAALIAERTLSENPGYAPDGVQRYVGDVLAGQAADGVSVTFAHDSTHADYEAFVKFRNELAADHARVEHGGGAPTIEVWPIITTER